MYLLIDTPCVGFISFFLGKKSVLSQVSPCTVFSSSLHPDCEDGRVQPLDENVGNAPGWRILEEPAIAEVASIIQGLGLLLCLTYICLHFYAQVRCTNQHVTFPPAQADGSSKWSLGNSLTPKLFSLFCSAIVKCGQAPSCLSFPSFFQQWPW